MRDEEIKEILSSSKTIAMIGISSEKKKGRSKKYKKKTRKCCDEVHAKFWI